ncbi:MAG TPA: hypothetical protein VGL53_28175 [Bryobacteraceae bacterium]|jgi:hypothetical protein
MTKTTSVPGGRPLQGISIGFSISESEDLADYGLDPSHINTVTLELCRRFIALGAKVVLGHQWRPNGVMESVARFAQNYHGGSESGIGPIIHNYMAWPDRAALTDAERKQLEPIVQIHEGSDEGRGRAEALSSMRSLVAYNCNARICIAGKKKQDSGLVHGVIEEAALTLARGNPVYMSSMMGGATAVMIDRLEGREGTPLEGGDMSRTNQYLDQIRQFGATRLAQLCGLTPDDLHTLFHSHNLDTLIQLTSRCLLARPRRNPL